MSIRCARLEQSGDLSKRIEVPVTEETRRALDQRAHDLKMDSGRPYSAADVARHYIEQRIAAEQR